MTVLIALAALPLLAATAVAAARAPFVLMAAYALLIPFGSGIRIPIGLPSGLDTVTSLVGLLVLLALGAQLGLGRRRAAELRPAIGIWLLFLALNVIGYLWSINRVETLEGLITLGALVALFVLAALSGVTRRDLSWVEVGIAAGGAITGLVAAYQLVRGTIGLSGGDIPRFRIGGAGEGGDPNITAATLLLPVAVATARAARERARRVAIGFATAAALSMLAILLTASRGGILAAATLLLVLAFNEQRPRLALAYLTLPAVVAAVALATAPAALVDRLQRNDSTGRAAIWQIGAEACWDSCWAGTGWDTFPDVHEERVLRAERASNQLRFEAHNAFLSTAVEGGLAALALLVAGLTLAARELLRLPARVRAAPLAALAALVVTNLFVANLGFKYFWFVLIYGVLVAEAYRTSRAADRGATGFSRPASTG